MAGDWLKIELITPDKPELVRMSASLRIDQDAVFGKLFRVWAWADQNSVDGSNLIVTAAFLDRLTNRRGFATAMRDAGWLTGEDGALSFPNFDRHNGATAKARSENNRRVTKHRAKCNGENVTSALQKPLPEKRREEKSKDIPEELTEETPKAASGAARELVILPTLDQAKAFAPSAGVSPDIAETWWNECEARPLASCGRFTDKNGCVIQKWQAHLTAYGRKWQSNDAQRAHGRKQPEKSGASAPQHSKTDTNL